MVAVLDSPFIDMAVRPGRWNVGPSEGSNLRRRKPAASKGERWQSEEVCDDQIVGAAEAQPSMQDVNIALAKESGSRVLESFLTSSWHLVFAIWDVGCSWQACEARRSERHQKPSEPP